MADELRVRMLEAAEKLLDGSPDRDVSTRAVCEAVGVGQPVLYRLFGDKNGLLSAVVDHGFDRYLAVKRAAEPSPDPVVDLRNGWDSHIAFALDHPAVYRLMFSPAFAAVPGAATEALGLLTDILRRVAAAGRLRVEPVLAAQTIMAGTIGVALSLITQPDAYTDPGLSHRVREALLDGLLTDPPVDRGDGPASIAPLALQLAALLRTSPGPLKAAEAALMLQWLDELVRQPVADR